MAYKAVFVLAFACSLSLVSCIRTAASKHENAESKVGGHKNGDPNKNIHPFAVLREPSYRSAPSNGIALLKNWANYVTNGGQYHGSKAQINLWGVSDVGYQQISSTTLWISNFDAETNNIQAGFHVVPQKYNDSKLHFYIDWTADDFKSTGCYNLECKGFVMVNWNVLTPGDEIGPVSVFGGLQYYITISIVKDLQTGNWLLIRDDDDDPQLIGYWPKSLFTTLAKSATHVIWGGFVSSLANEPGPAMGSGHYPFEQERKAAFIKHIEVVDSNGASLELENGANAYTTNNDCYNVSRLVDSRKFGARDGYVFYFGGPRGCTK